MQWTISKKLIISFLGISLLIGAAGGLGLINVLKIRKSTDIISDEEIPVTDAVTKMNYLLLKNKALIEVYKGATTAIPVYNEKILPELEEQFKSNIEAFNLYANAILNGLTIDDSAILPTKSPELRKIIKEASLQHISKFEGDAKEVIESGKEMLTQKDLAGYYMRQMETLYVYLKGLLGELEKQIPKELQFADYIEKSKEMIAALSEARIALEEIVQFGVIDIIEDLEKEFNTYVSQFDLFLSWAITNMTHNETKSQEGQKGNTVLIINIINSLSEYFSEFKKESAGLITAHKELINTKHRSDNAIKSLDNVKKSLGIILMRAVSETEKRVKRARSTSEKVQAHAQFILGLTTGIGTVLGILIGVFFGRQIIGKLNQLVKATQIVSDGDLEYKVHISSKDELGILAGSFNKMTENLKNTTFSKDYVDNIIKSMADALIVVNPDNTIKAVNEAAQELTGWNQENALGKPLLEVFHIINEKTCEIIKDLVGNIIKEGKTSSFSDDTILISKDGTERTIAHITSPLSDNEGKVIGAVIVFRDFTERRKAERELVEARKAAQEASRAKSEFLANMSHEIRTPMNGVVGMTELLQDTELKPEQREYVDAVSQSAYSLLNIINDILDFSKIEAGKLEMENINFDLRVLFDNIIDTFANQAGKKGIEFSCFVDPHLPFKLRGDPGRLRQVLVNLSNNAIKFTKKGEVAISVNLEKETESQVAVRFDIRDTGIGIPADKIKHLFRSFSQADSSTTRRFGGTGLGLAISKQIVELMRGQIGVKSKEGNGATFWFTSLFVKQSIGRQLSALEPGVIENMRVIVVEDNSTNRWIFKKYLESWHCRFEDAASAKEAMIKLHASVKEGDPFKVALIDYCMPDIDGESLGRQIKDTPQFKDIILVMLTSIGTRGDADRFQKLGFAAYLLKPLKQSQLFECLRIVTGKATRAEKEVSRKIVTRHSISEEFRGNVRILVAEDNLLNQKIVLRFLEKKLGYRADIVSTGKEVIKSLNKFDYELVLMDCHMPEMDGYEATRTIRDVNSSVKNHKIPIIAMTANAMQGDREKCLEAGMDDYVSKPVKLKEFADAIERNLGNLNKIKGAW